MIRAAARGVAPLLVAGLLGAAGCWGGGSEAPAPGARGPGYAGYTFHCKACHGADGRGSKHLFPPLAGSEWSQGPAGIPIRVVLNGLEGPLTVAGVDYMNLMPGLGQRLNDEEIAAILTYVRSAWGNAAGPVTAAEVASVRAATGEREKPWTMDDLVRFRDEAGEADADPAGGGPEDYGEP